MTETQRPTPPRHKRHGTTPLQTATRQCHTPCHSQRPISTQTQRRWRPALDSSQTARYRHSYNGHASHQKAYTRRSSRRHKPQRIYAPHSRHYCTYSRPRKQTTSRRYATHHAKRVRAMNTTPRHVDCPVTLSHSLAADQSPPTRPPRTNTKAQQTKATYGIYH